MNNVQKHLQMKNEQINGLKKLKNERFKIIDDRLHFMDQFLNNF